MNQPSPRDAVKLRHAGWWLALAGIGVVAIASLAVWRSRSTQPRRVDPSSGAAGSFSLPAISKSPFLNTTSDIAYVGSEACRACHQEHDVAFRHTSMGRSMAEVDLPREPPDGAFDHPLSKCRYEVLRRDGRLWHRELLLTDDPDDIVLSEFPVKYVIGSGHHCLTYAVEVDGFLVESPVTWYASRKAWGMSPGYDAAEHQGFERGIGEGCLICHAGQAEAIDNSLHRMHITEAAISCERCHGPGALHVAQHREKDVPREKLSHGIDHTIVNPAHLSRELAEAICQQCHLRSSATIPTRGHDLADFRPSLPLQDFRQDFWLDVPDKPMTVVGHVEQLHLSRCYQKSDKLTCLICHHPHDILRDEKSQAQHEVCLTCHRAEACREDKGRRLRDSPNNDCVQCHMPRSDTDIPHLAFTHHRIGIHRQSSPDEKVDHSSQPRSGVLRPFLDPFRLSEIDQQRSLGLGYLELANRELNSGLSMQYRLQAFTLLTSVGAAGLRDSMLDAALARIRFDFQRDDVAVFAKSSLSQGDLVSTDRCNALFLLADAHLSQGKVSEAVEALNQLTALRRHHMDWLLLADCEQKRGNSAAQKEALLMATRINPRLWNAHQQLAEQFLQEGDRERSEWHKRRAVK